MKISELIKDLEEEMKIEGDLDVFYYGNDGYESAVDASTIRANWMHPSHQPLVIVIE